jgi:death-on-curing family protein
MRNTSQSMAARWAFVIVACWNRLCFALEIANYDDPDLAALAAAYGFGLACNHPFIAGNKRTALMVTELFLALNGQELVADDPPCVITMLRLAEGSLSESLIAIKPM